MAACFSSKRRSPAGEAPAKLKLGWKSWISACAGMTILALGAPGRAEEPDDSKLGDAKSETYQISPSALKLARLLDPKSLGGIMVVGDIETEAARIEQNLHNRYSQNINSKCDRDLPACADAAKRISRDAAKIAINNKTKLIIRLYATAFDEKLSPKEIEKAVAFYSTSEGKKIAATQSSIASDTLNAIWSQALAKSEAEDSPSTKYQRRLFAAFRESNSKMLNSFLLQFDNETKNLPRSKIGIPRPPIAPPPPPPPPPPASSNK